MTHPNGQSWPTVELGEVCHVQLGKMLSPQSKTGKRPVPYLRNENVQWNRFDLRDVAWMDFTEDEEAKFALRPGDLLVCEGGEPGRAAIWQGQIERCCFQKALHRIRPLDGLLSSSYIMHFLWYTVREESFISSQSTTTISHLPREKLIQLRIPLPPLKHQESVVAELTASMASVEKARLAAHTTLSTASILRAACLSEVFSEDGCLSANPVMPTEPVRVGWVWRQLDELARLATGHTPSRRCPNYWRGDIPWLQLPDIRELDGQRAFQTIEAINQLGIDNSAAVRLPTDTVCMSRTASVGFVTILGREMATSQDFVNWVCGPDLCPEFLMWLFIASRQYVRRLASGATHHTVYFPTVKTFSICLPPICEQKHIAAALSVQLASADCLTGHCREQLNAIDWLPAALLREAFDDTQA